MVTRRRCPSRPGAALVPLLLLLLAVPFGDHAAAAGVGAPASGVGAPASGGAPGVGLTALQKHVAFFDRNHDGIVTFDETYEGLKEIGVGTIRAKASAAVINAGLGPKTRPDNANSSRMDVYIVNIHKGIHGSDTGAYDTQGRFVPEKLDEMFTKHGKTTPNAMTEDELDEMLKANREDKDFKGWLGASSEWKLLYKLAKDKDGYLSKDTVRTVYDGTLFYQLAAQGKKG